MDHDPDMEIEELRMEMAEDMEPPKKNNRKYRRSKAGGSGTPVWNMVIGGAVLIILIIILVSFFRGEQEISLKDLNAVKVSLAKLEERIIQLEGQNKEIQQSISEIDMSGSSLKQQVDRLAGNIEQLRKKAASVAARAEETAPVVRKKAVPKDRKHYYEVRAGDTLFHISKLYGSSVDELCRLNNFSKNQDIYPGQKILVPLKE